MTPRMTMALALTLAACAGDSGTAPPNGVGLEGTTWVLSQLGEKPMNPTAGQRQPYLMLTPEDQRASGHAGCNMFSGSYVLAGDTMTFTETAVTRMACAQGMDTEAAFLAALRETHGWSLEGSQLRLTDAAGKPLAVFTTRTGK